MAKLTDVMIKKSAVKDFVKGLNMRISSEAVDGMSYVVASKLEDAAARAKANGRSTIKLSDF